MRTLLIVGGKLQGVEAAYLAAEAGYRTVLVDRRKDVPAAGLVSEALVFDIFDEVAMLPLMATVDAVLPALEDIGALEQLTRYEQMTGTPLICDLDCYQISSSKRRSNSLFGELAIAVPSSFPACGFPVIVKPDGKSGSQGVAVARTQTELDGLVSGISGPSVIQLFAQGRSYSMEVLGDGENYRCLPITEVCIASDYDCLRIVAPAEIDSAAREKFERVGDTLGRALRIKGIFDVEVIVEDGIPLVLEIDARLPSQTPISVYHATGINMVEMLVETVCTGFPEPKADRSLACLYQQVEMTEDGPCIIGEHPVSLCGPLRYHPGFFGADFALTDFDTDRRRWRAIIVVTAPTYERAWKRFDRCWENLEDQSRQRENEKRMCHDTTR